METKDVIGIAGLSVSIIAACVSAYFALQAKRLKEETLKLHRDTFINQYVDRGCEEFKSKGTPYHYISTLSISAQEQEEVWRLCYLRHKKRPPETTFASASPPPHPEVHVSVV